MQRTLAEELGLVLRPTFIRDRQFLLALAAAPGILAALLWLLPQMRVPAPASPLFVLSMVVWQPLIEELLFRGVIQGQLARMPWARRHLHGFTCANCVTTVLFVLAHFVTHPPSWAVAVTAPSLLFGYFRDRHQQVYPAILLHGFYNGCYVVAMAR